MKILSISAQKPHSTGSGTYMTELVKSFNASGHKQAVVCGMYPYDKAVFPDGVICYPVYFTDIQDTALMFERDLSYCSDEMKYMKWTPETVSYPVVGMSDVMPYTSTLYSEMTDDMISEFEHAFIATINRAVTDLDPDLIICHHLFLLTALVRRHFPGRCIYGISHGSDLRQMTNCDALREFVRPYIGRLDKIFALHSEQAEEIKNVFGVDDDKICVIGSGYNDRCFNSHGRMPRIYGEPIRICCVGKMSKAKGIPELLNALAELKKDESLPPFTLTLAGGCRDDDVLDLLEHLPSYAEWLGFISTDELAELYRRSDVFVLPSYFEGLPLVIMEAMASGMLPVCTDLPGIRHWIESHISDSNAVFVPQPEMKTIDEPTEIGRKTFTGDLAYAISSVLRVISTTGSDIPVPDTSKVTWDAVCERILDNYCQ